MYVPASALYLAINPYIHTRMYIPNHILVLQIRLVGHVENGQVTIVSFGFARHDVSQQVGWTPVPVGMW
jgi:hypothetical protein